MSAVATIKRYQYTRGDTYSVDVIVNNNNIMVYCNWKVPDDIGEKVFEKFTEEAEHAVLKKISEAKNGSEG